MTKGIFRTTLILVLMGMFACSAIIAADANAPSQKRAAAAPVAMKGMVSVVKDASGAIKAVKLTTEDKVAHELVLDKESIELAKMDGKEVIARVIKKDGVLKVVSFKPAEKASKPAPKQAPKTKPSSKK